MEDQSSAFTFNPLKHHLSFLKEEIPMWEKFEWESVSEALQSLGNNQYDVYTGKLGVPTILREAEEFLSNHGIRNREGLRQLLGEKGYTTFLLSDGSKWIVRESEPREVFAHLHPARYQPDVTRVKASHIKTAVAMILEGHFSGCDWEKPDTGKINRLRRNRLGLSPVRSLEESRRIMETFHFITKEEGIP